MKKSKIYKLEDALTPNEAIKERLKHIGFTGQILSENYLGIENCIGKISFPVGIAGPIDGVYIPLATTESALIASVNRGCKYLKLSNLSVETDDFGITRAPSFRFGSNEDAEVFSAFIESIYKKIEKLFNTEHLKLLDIQVLVDDCDVILRFVADAGDAMGMNMITIAVSKVVKSLILPKSPVDVLYWVLSSNFCSDKKVSLMNIRAGRGMRVKVTCELNLDQYEYDVVKCENIFDMKYVKGSSLAGCVTSNGHVSNIIAALFLSFGQDLGHVPDSSQADFSLAVKDKTLIFTLEIYNLLIGVVGGGTNQSYVRDFMKFCNINTRKDLAELIAKACMAGEISLFLSLVDGDLAESHENLRKRNESRN